MKNFFASCILCFSLALLSSSAHSEELNKRKGFFLGFGAGGSAVSSSDGTEASFLNTGFRIGGGINENIILMAETYWVVSSPNDVDGLVAHFSSQMFVKDNFYVRPGIGVGGNKDFDEDFNFSFSAVTSLGHEFRLGKRFAISPEIKLNYFHQGNGTDFFSYGVDLGFLWYF